MVELCPLLSDLPVETEKRLEWGCKLIVLLDVSVMSLMPTFLFLMIPSVRYKAIRNLISAVGLPVAVPCQSMTEARDLLAGR